MSVTGSAAWLATAAYLYLLRLDAVALAWEYLRRNTGYTAAWRRVGRAHSDHERHRGAAAPWGLRFPGEPFSGRPNGTSRMAA